MERAENSDLFDLVDEVNEDGIIVVVFIGF